VKLAIPKRIIQVDAETFSITWDDGIELCYTLFELQRKCPCALCSTHPEKIALSGVSAKAITSVGRYGLRIEFTKGCSLGIYNYELLRYFYDEA